MHTKTLGFLNFPPYPGAEPRGILLIKLVRSLDDFPEKYSKETLLIDDPENFRSVSKWNYKIIYEVTENQIIIADIFHTSQHPSKFKRIRK